MRGVYYDSNKEKWHAAVIAYGVKYSGGYFDDFEDACDAVVALRAKHYDYVNESVTRA